MLSAKHCNKVTIAMLQSLVFLLTISSVSAFNISRVQVASDQSTRRDIIKKLGITIGISSISSPANADVISGARCANGQGDGCELGHAYSNGPRT